MSKQWGSGFHTGMEKGVDIGAKHGEASAVADFGTRALCLATAIRNAQKSECFSQYVLLEVLIDLLANKCGGRLQSEINCQKKEA